VQVAGIYMTFKVSLNLLYTHLFLGIFNMCFPCYIQSSIIKCSDSLRQIFEMENALLLCLNLKS
jgi:hypothetical protein